jgi:hypothetical protein
MKKLPAVDNWIPAARTEGGLAETIGKIGVSPTLFDFYGKGNFGSLPKKERRHSELRSTTSKIFLEQEPALGKLLHNLRNGFVTHVRDAAGPVSSGARAACTVSVRDLGPLVCATRRRYSTADL